MRINIAEYFLASVSGQPAARCLQTPDTEQTYEQVFRQSYAISEKLIAYRLLPVVVLLPKSVSAINGIIGTVLSGNIYVPVDVSAPIERLEKIISSLGDCIVLYNEMTKNIVGSFSEQASFHSINVDGIVAKEALTIDEMVSGVRSQISYVIDTDPAYIIFTSGSTGAPKGVTVSHRSIIDYIDWANSVYAVCNKDIVGSQAPFYFDNSTLDLYLSFSNCATLNLIPDSIFIFPAKLLDYLNQYHITTIFWVPSLLVNIANLGLLESIKLPYLKNVLFAGEVMPAKQLKYWLKNHPNTLYSNLYGPTEITVDCTYFNVPADWDGDDLPIGIPCRNTDILVLDDNDNLSETGELCVRGSSLALGYWADTEKSDKVFVQNPLNGKYRDLIYRTGDLVRVQDGLIYFMGRKDFQIKHNGYRIELGEIETVVSNLDCVASCVAGYLLQQKVIYLCVIPVSNIALTEFRKLLIAKLPRYMMPTKIVFYDAFPMTPNGKVNRLALRDQLAEGG
jgi:amino acid adenylation domain-containing protein